MSCPGSDSRSHSHCGRTLAMKGCLKSPLPSPGLATALARKNVAFGKEISEEIHLADVWDRTPMEPARNLSYQDLLELKEIQRSLPRANQLDDPVSGKLASHYLSAVPIGLLPLLSESSNSQDSSATNSPVTSPVSSAVLGSSPPTWSLSTPRSAVSPPPQPWHPPHLAHLLPSKPTLPRQKPKFAFLPLLDTPPPSEAASPYNTDSPSRSPSPEPVPSDTDQSQDPPTPSLTNASLDSSPLSRSSSTAPSPEPPFLELPPLRGKGGEYHYRPHFETHDHHFSANIDEGGYLRSYHAYHESPGILPSLTSLRIDGTRPSAPRFPPPLSNTTAWSPFPDRTMKHEVPTSPQRAAVPSQAKPARRRNFMVLNGIEIEIEDEDDGDTAPSTPAPTPLSRTPCTSAHSSPRSERGRELPPALKPSSSPVLSSSPPSRCAASLYSPIRFQREKGSKSAAA